MQYDGPKVLELSTHDLEMSVNQELNNQLSQIIVQNQDIAQQVDNAQGLELVVAAQKDASITKDQLIATGDNQYTLILSHKTIMTLAGIASTAGGYIGYGLGHAAGIEAGKKVAEAAENKLSELGQNFTGDILKAVGLQNLPFTKFFVDAEVSNLAHETAEKLRKETIKLAAKRGGVLGSATAAGMTIVALELLNLVGMGVQYCAPTVKGLFNDYVMTPFYNAYQNYNKEGHEANLKALAAKQDEEEERLANLPKLEDDWVMVESKSPLSKSL